VGHGPHLTLRILQHDDAGETGHIVDQAPVQLAMASLAPQTSSCPTSRQLLGRGVSEGDGPRSDLRVLQHDDAGGAGLEEGGQAALQRAAVVDAPL